MKTREALRLSLGLLTPRDRRLLILVTIMQMSTAFLDLVGILLIGAVTALSVSIISEVPPPQIVANLIEMFEPQGMNIENFAAVLGVTAACVLILKSLINMFITRRILRFLANRQAMVAGRLAEGLLSRPLIELQQRSSQEAVYALTGGVNAATLVILSQAVIAATEITLLLVLALGLMFVSPSVTLFTVLFFGIVALLLQRILSGWAGRLGREYSKAEVASYETVQEAIRTYREVLVADRRKFYVSKFQVLRWQASRIQSDSAFLYLVPKYVFEVALVVGAGLLAISQFLTQSLTAAVAIIAIFLAAGSRIVPSMLRLQTAAITLRNAAGQASPTFELADELRDSIAGSGIELSREAPIGDGETFTIPNTSYEGFIPNISSKHLTAIYPGSHSKAVDDVSFTLAAGASMALVGPTGAGKSTLADLLLGVADPETGEITIGGCTPVEAIRRWPGAVAYVPQDVAMANGTVRANVALGLPENTISDELVWQALDRAHLSEFMRDSRDGLETVIGENGVKLSGGQRQRLGVARALYTRPKLLVLDEATSALDAETEEAISSTLQDLEGDVTTVTIAHRLATIRHCDLILYIESGKVVAQGSFDEVRLSSQRFDRQARLLGL